MSGINHISDRERCGSSNSTVRLAGMVLVPTGSFLMGSDEGSEAERPIREIHVDAFYMDETPVTNQQFGEFVRDSGYKTEAERSGAAWGYQSGRYSLIEGLSWHSYAKQGREDHPVVLVSWHDAVAFARWSGKRLPTEAQWERAARGGLVGKFYPWGDQKPDGSQCNFARTSSEFPGTSRVKSFPANDFGLYDMVGNVWQWCSDLYSQCGSAEEPLEEGTGDEANALRARRGGAWNVIQPFRLRCSNRGAMGAQSAVPNVGFRCVIDDM